MCVANSQARKIEPPDNRTGVIAAVHYAAVAEIPVVIVAPAVRGTERHGKAASEHTSRSAHARKVQPPDDSKGRERCRVHGRSAAVAERAPSIEPQQ